MSGLAGPFFEDLVRGQRFVDAPAMTLTEGYAAAHRAIVGDRLRLSLDDSLAISTTGTGGLVHPAAVWDVAIGQSTLVTRSVVGNLFYRGLAFHRLPRVSDTLRTSTEVVALKQNTRRPGRRATGLAALRITTCDQDGRTVLDFWRCAMLPMRDDNVETGHADEMASVGENAPAGLFASITAGWDLSGFREANPGVHFNDLQVGQSWSSGGDVVSSAPELARLTLNIAEVHHDAIPTGKRLVYGGHTIGIALAQASRELPNLLTVVGWHGCDHLGPVTEGDTLRSTVTVEQLEPLQGGGGLVHLRSCVTAQSSSNAPPENVLDWRFVGVMA